MGKILCVIRVSTNRQETASQKADMQAFLSNRNEEIVWLEAIDASARKANKKYLEMLDTIKTRIMADNEIKTVALWHINRLGRIETYLSQMKDWFILNKIQVLIKTPSITLLNYDGSVNAAGSISWSVFAALQKFETDEMMEKMQRGRDYAENVLGKFHGGNTPFGFDLIDSYLKVNEGQMEIVREIHRLYADATLSYNGKSLSAEMTSRGIKLSYQQIYYILESPIYDPYVDAGLRQRCTEKKKANVLGKAPKERTPRLAYGILKCPNCGGNYIVSDGVYHCYNYTFKKWAKTECNHSIRIKVDVIEFLLLYVANLYYIEYLTSLGDETRKDAIERIDVARQKISNAEQEIAETKIRLDKAAEMYVMGNISKEKLNALTGQINANKTAFEMAIATWKNEIDRYSKILEDCNTPERFVNIALGVYAIKDKAEHKEIVRRYIERADLSKIPFANSEATKVKITAVNGDVFEFVYDNLARGSRPKLFKVLEDGKLKVFNMDDGTKK